jgi:hypothetical protein
MKLLTTGLLLLAWSAALSASMAEEPQGAKEAKAFWAALAEGDTKAMKDFYAEKVVLLPGSELLKPRWELPGKPDRDKGLLIARDELLAGYRMIARLGKEKWSKVFKQVPAEKIRVEELEIDLSAPGDGQGSLVLEVLTGPGDDKLIFMLDKDDEGHWRIVAEQTDY